MSAPSVQSETREINVIVPLGDKYDEPEFLRQIEAALITAYPDFRFKVTADSPHRMEYDFFVLILVPDKASSSSDSMLMPTLLEIGTFLRGYTSRHH